MGPIEKFLVALEANDIDILAPDAEKQAFGDKKKADSISTMNSKSDDLEESPEENEENLNTNDDTDEETDDLNMDDEEDEDEDYDENQDNNNSSSESEDETRIKQNIRIKLKYLYDIVSSNLDKLVSLDHEIKNNDIEKYSKIQSKFTDLKLNLFKFITDDEYLSKDCGTYTKYYITSKELYNLCIQMTEIFFQEYKSNKENKKSK